MARGSTLTPRRVKNAEDRNAGRGEFLTLKKIGEQFEGFALFKPDPELSDNPGYYEYFEHYTQSTGYVPCAGDDCVLCEEGDRPSTRAKTLWLVNDEVKIFTFNWNMIQEFVDLLGDDEPIQGRLFRIKRLDDRGKYAVRPKADKIKVAEIKAALKNGPEIEKLVTNQLMRAYEEMETSAAMEEDNDDDEPKQTARKGKVKAKPEPEDDGALDEATVTIEKVIKRDNALMVTDANGDEVKLYCPAGEIDAGDFEKGQDVVVSTEIDEDGDHIVTEIEAVEAEEEGEPESDELPDSIEGEVFTVVQVNESDETLDLKGNGIEFTLYFLDEGEAADVDWDDYDEGKEVVVTAVKDSDGDLVADKHVPQVVAKTRKTATRKKATGTKRK